MIGLIAGGINVVLAAYIAQGSFVRRHGKITFVRFKLSYANIERNLMQGTLLLRMTNDINQFKERRYIAPEKSSFDYQFIPWFFILAVVTLPSLWWVLVSYGRFDRHLKQRCMMGMMGPRFC